MSKEVQVKSQPVFYPFDMMSRRIYGNFTTTPDPLLLHPFEYSGWRNEVESWKKDCYIHVALNPHATALLEGEDVIKFLEDYCVNSFKKFPIGSAKHTIFCNKDGFIFCDGVLLRVAENKFESHGTLPVIEYPLSLGDYKVKLTDISREVFNIQMGGPRSLEILEAAANENLHDINFCRFRESQIDGIPVRILRLGMSGTLAYEIHGKWEDFLTVYQKVLEAGEKYGLRQIGLRAYTMTHWENGFPQASLDYPWAPMDEGYEKFLLKKGLVHFAIGDSVMYSGSMGTDTSLRWKTPYDVGWEKMVAFDHDFLGRAALEKIAENQPRKMVTLEWDTDDIVKVYRSQFETGEMYKLMDEPEDFSDIFFRKTKYVYNADKVIDASGNVIGISSGRMVSSTYRKMISLCSLNTAYAQNGEEVFVIWGDPGQRQIKIRAKVARYPYLDQLRNENTDVSTIPYGFNK